MKVEIAENIMIDNLECQMSTPRKINMEPENTGPPGKIIFQTIIFSFYVNLRGSLRS